MSKPRVSIIMGIYNVEKTLDEAIESLQNQTFQDWKLIMCDDGSMDQTYRIAESYARQEPKKYILLKNEKNMGLNFTLNHCLEYADTEYIARMDGDDICEPHRLEKEVKFLDSHPEYALVSTEMLMFDENGIWGKTTVIEHPTKKDFCKHTPFFCHAAVMIRGNIFKEVGGYTVDPKLLRVEDCHLWFKIYAKGYVGANIPEPLYSMRDDRNAMHRRGIKGRANGIYVMFVGFKMIHMPFYLYWYPVLNVFLEMAKCLIPGKLYMILHKRKFEKK